MSSSLAAGFDVDVRDFMIGHHFSISALWYAPSASAVCCFQWRDHLAQALKHRHNILRLGMACLHYYQDDRRRGRQAK